jgi:hypothetical protein
VKPSQRRPVVGYMQPTGSWSACLFRLFGFGIGVHSRGWWPYLQKLTNGKRVFGIKHCDEVSLKTMYVVHRALEGEAELKSQGESAFDDL